MTKLEFELTEQQEKFLKEFAEKQYPGADDNVCTVNAIHAVETYRPRHIPYHEDFVDYYDDLPLIFTTDTDYDNWLDSEVKAVQEWYDGRGKEPDIKIVPFKELEYKTIELKNSDGDLEEEIFVMNYDDYFKAYRINFSAAAWLQDNYEPVAFFFILDEAKRYIEYQGHNLTKPRTYTYSSG
ncbi:hypothetical protein [Paenibacillus sp. FSL E2-0178]|uniref:hypothetical protein n=1 Tax=Paenibacillus sp. FSL E2-0178 TaxID=2921361 RepID=UPI00315925FC